MAQAAWAINRGGKTSVRNLRYGPRTRLVRGYLRSHLVFSDLPVSSFSSVRGGSCNICRAWTIFVSILKPLICTIAQQKILQQGYFPQTKDHYNGITGFSWHPAFALGSKPVYAPVACPRCVYANDQDSPFSPHCGCQCQRTSRATPLPLGAPSGVWLESVLRLKQSSPYAKQKPSFEQEFLAFLARTTEPVKGHFHRHTRWSGECPGLERSL